MYRCNTFAKSSQSFDIKKTPQCFDETLLTYSMFQLFYEQNWVGDTDRQVWQVYLILPNQHVTWIGRPWSSTRTWPSRWRTLPLSVLLKHWKSIRLKRKLLFTSGKLFFFFYNLRLFFFKNVKRVVVLNLKVVNNLSVKCELNENPFFQNVPF